MISSNIAVESAQLGRPAMSGKLLVPRRAILVTGGTGYTGGYLASALIAAGHGVRILARTSSDLSRLPPGVEVVYGDLKDHDTHRAAVDGIDIVFHIAAAFRDARLSVREYEAINVEASEALADAAARAGVARFVHCSTGGVHGHVEFPPANEDAPVFGLEPPLHNRRVDLFVKNRCFDISRARRELGYAPKVSVDEGIRRTFRWYRENGWM